MISRAWNSITKADDIEALKRRLAELEMAFKEELARNVRLERKLERASAAVDQQRVETIKLRGRLIRTQRDLGAARDKLAKAAKGGRR